MFNDDDITDYVYILINEKDNLKYLYVFVSTRNGYKALLLDGAGEQEMGVATHETGLVLTASGKGYWEPTEDDPPEVYVKKHAIAYFMFESAGSIFVWNAEGQKFDRHWTSD